MDWDSVGIDCDGVTGEASRGALYLRSHLRAANRAPSINTPVP